MWRDSRGMIHSTQMISIYNVKSFLLKYFNKFKVSNRQQHEQPFPNLTMPNAILLSYCITRPWLYTNQYPAGRVHLPVQCAFFQATRIKCDMVKAFMTRKFAFCYFITYEYNKDFKSQIIENIFFFKKHRRFYQKNSTILSRIWHFRCQSVYYTCRANKELNRNINVKACFRECGYILVKRRSSPREVVTTILNTQIFSSLPH